MIDYSKIQVLILAAGKGSRMNSETPKVLMLLNNKPMLFYILETLKDIGIKDILILVGYKKEEVIKSVDAWLLQNPSITITFAVQTEQNGTGHAVLSAKPYIQNLDKKLLVLLGDVPLVKKDTIINSINTINKNDELGAIVLTTKFANPFGYGRIIKHNNKLIGIKEETDANEIEKQITEVNTGIFIFNGKFLWKYIDYLTSNNHQHELYLTDIISIFNTNNITVHALMYEDSYQFIGANSINQLESLEEIYKQKYI